jgi:hypothetical protein
MGVRPGAVTSMTWVKKVQFVGEEENPSGLLRDMAEWVKANPEAELINIFFVPVADENALLFADI